MNKILISGLQHLSVPLQICNGTDISGIILAHIPWLMGADFCAWCGICAKFLAFSTYPTSTVGALITNRSDFNYRIIIDTGNLAYREQDPGIDAILGYQQSWNQRLARRLVLDNSEGI